MDGFVAEEGGKGWVGFNGPFVEEDGIGVAVLEEEEGVFGEFGYEAGVVEGFGAGVSQNEESDVEVVVDVVVAAVAVDFVGDMLAWGEGGKDGWVE